MSVFLSLAPPYCCFASSPFFLWFFAFLFALFSAKPVFEPVYQESVVDSTQKSSNIFVAESTKGVCEPQMSNKIVRRDLCMALCIEEGGIVSLFFVNSSEYS